MRSYTCDNMLVCTCVHILPCMSICLPTYLPIYTSTHIYIYIHIHVITCIRIYPCLHLYGPARLTTYLALKTALRFIHPASAVCTFSLHYILLLVSCYLLWLLAPLSSWHLVLYFSELYVLHVCFQLRMLGRNSAKRFGARDFGRRVLIPVPILPLMQKQILILMLSTIRKFPNNQGHLI